GRTRLATAFASTPKPANLRSLETTEETPVHQYRRRATRTARWTALGVGLLGAAAAVTLVVTSETSAGAPGTPSAAQAPSVEPIKKLSAQQVLLAAATSAAKTPADGAYWVRSSLTGKQRVEPGGKYTLEMTTLVEAWVSQVPGKPTWFINQNLGIKPATPQDEEAWRAAGSPHSWTYPGTTVTTRGKSFKTPSVTLQSKPGEPVTTRLDGDKSDSSVGKPMTRAALSELPTTPDGLRDYLKTVIAKQWGAEPVDVNAELYQAGVHIIMDLPAPPDVRAAAFRMLASLPGVKAEGEVTDPLGRTGQAVSLPHSEGEGRLIMNTATGEPLAFVTTVKEDRVFVAIKKARWTDDKPDLSASRRGSDDPPA
ncbi:MAG: CU044_5270 family protein, partial [Nonomuraea sp.]|nr:CU044_5270 family protein [Nonomuraea sp.]